MRAGAGAAGGEFQGEVLRKTQKETWKDMSRRRWSALAVTVGFASMMLCSGCGLFGGKKGTETEGMLPNEIPTSGVGDLPMGARDGGGTLMTTPESQIEHVMFAFDSYQIEQTEIPKIEKAAAFLKSNAGVRLVTEGHCDERGSNEYNMSLGEHRALAIRANLISLGIGGDRIQTRSFGEERPADSGHNEEAWRINRRGEFALYR